MNWLAIATHRFSAAIPAVAWHSPCNTAVLCSALIPDDRAGSNLSNVAATKNREQFLAALITPTAEIAKGHGTVVYGLNDGRTASGTIKSDSEDEVVLVTLRGTTVAVDRSQIDQRSDVTSGMPAIDRVLPARQLRDIVEFLSSSE